MFNLAELREQLTDEAIKDILIQYDVEPVRETENEIVFPTCCHNLIGGSPKLYYYKDNHIFICYTECNKSFDIFDLLIKMHRLRGETITLRQAIGLCSLDISYLQDSDLKQYDISQDLRFLKIENHTRLFDTDDLQIRVYDKDVLRRYAFDYTGLQPWIQEGIGIEMLQKFNIKFNQQKNCIIIPNFDIKGNLIGIRGRFFRPEDVAKGKYRPIYDNGTLYSYPTGKSLYGLYENHKTIEKKKMCILFEGEKSVLLFGSIYGADNNISLATLGQNITREQIQYLREMKVRDVILAYDTDYEDLDELKEVKQKYIEKARILTPYFNVGILLDYNFLLPYKSSPIDGGREVFEKILSDQLKVS